MSRDNSPTTCRHFERKLVGDFAQIAMGREDNNSHCQSPRIRSMPVGDSRRSRAFGQSPAAIPTPASATTTAITRPDPHHHALYFNDRFEDYWEDRHAA